MDNVVEDSGISLQDLAPIVNSLDISLQDFAPIYDTLSERERNVYRVVHELYKTEKDRYETMRSVALNLPTVLKDNEISIDLVDKCAEYLRPLEYLSTISKIIINDFEERLQNWVQTPHVGDLVLASISHIKMYAAMDPKMKQLGQEMQKLIAHNETLKIQVEAFFKNVKSYRTFENIGQLVERRILQFQLLLKEYRKQLVAGNLEDDLIDQAIVEMDKVAQNLNRTVTTSGMAEFFIHLQKNVISKKPLALFEGDENIVKCGYLTIFGNDNHEKKILVVLTGKNLYLFKKTQCSRYLYKSCVSLKDAKVASSKADDFQAEFGLVTKSISLLILTGDNENRDEWLSAITTTPVDAIMTNSLALGKEAPIRFPLTRFSKCGACDEQFWKTKPSYCKSCGKGFCHICLSSKLSLPYLDGKEAKICHICFELLQNAEHQQPIAKIYQNEENLRMASNILVAQPGNDWMERYCVLKGENIAFYKAAEDQTPTRVFHIDEWDLGHYEDLSKATAIPNHCFFWLQNKTDMAVLTFTIFYSRQDNERIVLAKKWISSLKETGITTNSTFAPHHP